MKKNKKISEENKILIFEEGENFAFSWHGQSFGIAADVAMLEHLATWASNKAAFLVKIKEEEREEITEETSEDRAALFRRKFPPKQAFKNKRKKSKK